MTELKFFFALIVISLATWRLSRILATPEKIAVRLHLWAGSKPDPDFPGRFIPSDTFVGYLISCFPCMSVWVAVFLTAAWIVSPYLVLPFAASGVAVLLLEQGYG